MSTFIKIYNKLDPMQIRKLADLIVIFRMAEGRFPTLAEVKAFWGDDID